MVRRKGTLMVALALVIVMTAMGGITPATAATATTNRLRAVEVLVKSLRAQMGAVYGRLRVLESRPAVRGSEGPAGPQGATGPAGHQGDAGSVGSKGDAGAVGPQGDKGDLGPTGSDGQMGPSGSASLEGFWPAPVTFKVDPRVSRDGITMPDFWMLNLDVTPEVGTVAVKGIRGLATLHTPYGDFTGTLSRIDVPGDVNLDGLSFPVEYWVEWGGYTEHKTVILTVR